MFNKSNTNNVNLTCEPPEDKRKRKWIDGSEINK